MTETALNGGATPQAETSPLPRDALHARSVEESRQAIVFILPRRKIIGTLAVVTAVLLMLSLAGQVARFQFDHPTVFGLVDLFYLDLENNLPTWYQSVIFLFAAALMALIGISNRSIRMPFAGHWLALAAIFVFLSLDEVASLHERTIEPIQRVIKPTGIWAPTWVILGLTAVVILALVYWRFFLHLQWRERLHILLAGIVFLGGALAAEMATGVLFDTTDPDFKNAFAYALVANLEETMEMIGLVIFLDFLLRRASVARPLHFVVINT